MTATALDLRRSRVTGNLILIAQTISHARSGSAVAANQERNAYMKNILDEYLIGSKKRQSLAPQQSYPVVTPDPESLKYFKDNPEVTGWAFGAGMNDSDPKSPRVVMLNPYSKLTKEQQGYVVDNERIRHYMDEKNYNPAFKPTKEQSSFFHGTGYGKPENEKFLKQTLVARIITGDETAGNITPEQSEEAYRLLDKYQKERGSLSFMKSPTIADSVMSAIKLKK